MLGWGGGLAALDARGGVAAVLAEVASAASVALDRWRLAIAPSHLEAAVSTVLCNTWMHAGCCMYVEQPARPTYARVLT